MMSIVMYLAPGVEMVLFQCILVVVILAVGIAVSPSYMILLPPTVILVLKGSSFYRR